MAEPLRHPLALFRLPLRAFVVAASLAASTAAAPICDLVFEQCPDKSSGAVITVPKNVLALDYRIPYCNEKVQVSAGGKAGSLSVVFVIDHSYSMDWSTDTGYARFSQTAALIKSIAAGAPDAQVGLVVFRDDLRFDDRDSKYFKPAFPGDLAHPHDAYFPLTRLDTVFSNGRTGHDSLEEFLRVGRKKIVEMVSNGVPGQDYPETTYTPYLVHETKLHDGDTTGGTNITLGFKAAKAAMQKSIAPPENRYIVFLSDGDAQLPADLVDHPELRPDLNDFEKGEGVPTTFTIFFNEPDSAPSVPASIRTMTENIRGNHYSAGNPNSTYFPINSPSDKLLRLLETQVLGRILVFPTQPKSASVASSSGTWSTSASAAGNFVFAKRIPLSGTDETFQLSITFSYVDSSGGQRITRDTVVKTSLSVHRADAASPPAGFTTACREQEDLGLYYAGAPVAKVTSQQATLEARLTPSPGEACNGCRVEVKTARSAPPGDKESLVLAALSATVAGKSFARELKDPPTAGDGRLQHLASDSIVLVYRNPDVPLDTVRRAYAFEPAVVPPPDTLKPPPPDTTPVVDTAKPVIPPAPPPVLRIAALNEVARPDPVTPQLPQGGDIAWHVAASAGLSAPQCCGLLSEPLDSATYRRYVGAEVEASRAFTLKAQVFTNFGALVNAVDLTLSREQFAALPQGSQPGSRVLKLWWGNRARNGELAGTGAYILRVWVVIEPEGDNPGRAEKSTRIFGLLR
jgi:hypothetical protein